MIRSASQSIDYRRIPLESEARFYKGRHQAGGVHIGGATSLEAFEQDMLAPGKRYHLVAERLAHLQPRKGHLAEIGCGGAEALLLLSGKYRFDRVTGVDIATLSAGSDRSSGIELMAANLNDVWPFPDRSVDYLIAMMVIEHLFDPFHAFREIKRLLSDAGEAYVNLPVVTSLRNRLRLLSGSLPVTSSPYPHWFEIREWDGNHLHYFSIDSIRDLASACGLQVSDIRGVGKLAHLKTWWPSLFASEITFRLTHAN